MSKGRKLLGLGVLIVPAPALASPDVSKDEVAQIEAAAVAADQATAAAAARGSVIYAFLDGKPYKIEADKVPEPATREQLGAWIGATGPLTGPDGRPACGNVMSKAQDPCVVARASSIAAREQAIQAKVAADVAKAKQRLAAQTRRAKK
jgi:hypothetical protein